MLLFYFSMGLTILSGLLYHVSQKATPRSANPIVSIIVTYIVAIVICLIVLPFYPEKMNLAASLKELNWASYALAFAIVGLEIGFLLAYRAGWIVGTAAVFSNVVVALLLVPVGLLLFKEKISTINLVGIVVCIAGLVLVNQR